MDTGLLLWIHAYAHPWLDVLFIFSDRLATLRFSAALVLALVAWHVLRSERRAAWTWFMLGAGVWTAQSSIKAFVGRPRPQLFAHLVTAGGFAMPSGHALASAAFYPVLAWVLARRHPAGARVYWTLGVLLPLYIGVGRLYLGVHWPTDVLVGWLIGGLAALLAVRWLDAPRAGRL